MAITRRDFLATTTAVSLGFAGVHNLLSQRAFATPRTADIAEGFGPLRPDPAGVFDLPKGFMYKIIGRQGETMSDGFYLPGRADGMAAFAGPDGRPILVRNHELSPGSPEEGPFGKNYELLSKLPKEKAYELGHGKHPALGGTTTVLFNTKTGEVEGQRLSLAGTIRNCAGGPTPWNSWVTCEENTDRAGDDLEKDHGYNFEVPADFDAGLADPIPLTAMGRFNHEAIAVDPVSGIVYETEDRHDSLIYRFIPNEPGKLAKGGKLQALALADAPRADTRNWESDSFPRNARMYVTWIDLDEIDSPKDDLRLRGHHRGAAVFARGEGMWAGNDGIYFACTNGGKAKKGQIWRYIPSPSEGTPGEAKAPGILELFVEPNDGGLIDNADNLTVAPWGDVIVCEDGSGEQYLVGITPQGGIYKFGRNAKSESELAGATFSPDGSTLFVNIQHDGLTLAITGPWRQA